MLLNHNYLADFFCLMESCFNMSDIWQHSSIHTRLKRIEHLLNVFHARYTFHVIVQNIEVKKFLIQDMQDKYTRNQTITMD